MFSRISNLFSIEISRILHTAFFICVRNTQLHTQSYTEVLEESRIFASFNFFDTLFFACSQTH